MLSLTARAIGRDPAATPFIRAAQTLAASGSLAFSLMRVLVVVHRAGQSLSGRTDLEGLCSLSRRVGSGLRLILRRSAVGLSSNEADALAVEEPGRAEGQQCDDFAEIYGA